jgi:hypothetical protein
MVSMSDGTEAILIKEFQYFPHSPETNADKVSRLGHDGFFFPNSIRF